MQMTLTAVGRLQCGRAQTCYIGGFILFSFFFSREQRTKPCLGERARDAPLCSLSLVLRVLGFFAVVVGGPRGTMLTKKLYFHAVEIILVSFGIHAAINGFYFCVTPNSHLL